MIPLLESCPKEAEAMLEYILVENADTMSIHISEIFFIEDIKVSEKIASVVKAQIEKTLPEGFEANLNLWLRRITNDSDEVRTKALSHLKKFLGKHRSELNEMILADTDVHPLVVKLLDALLAGCQDKDENIRLGSGECLGELGAVEPSLLPRRIVARGSLAIFQSIMINFSIQFDNRASKYQNWEKIHDFNPFADDSKFITEMNEDFASATLIELVRAFQMQKSTRSMDCFSLAIQVCIYSKFILFKIFSVAINLESVENISWLQEILKTYEISPKGKNSNIWNSLPSTTQQIIFPFLTSHYKITTTNDENEFPHPIYG